MEFVQFTEGQTKTQPLGLHTKYRNIQPQMFTVGEERSAVTLFKQFATDLKT